MLIQHLVFRKELRELCGWDGEKGHLNCLGVALAVDAGCRQFIFVLACPGRDVQDKAEQDLKHAPCLVMCLSDSNHCNKPTGTDRTDFMVVGFTVKELSYIRLVEARVSKSKRIFSSTCFPMAKFTTFEQIG